MAEEDPAISSKNASEEPAPIVLPPRDSLPPPPDVSYTRPERSGQGQVSRLPLTPRPGLEGGSPAVKLGSGIAAGTTFVASVIAGFLIGQWIDHRWNHGGGMPWGTLVFSLLGVAAGFLNLFRVLAATDRRTNKK